jgi:hypothetical protein
MLKYILITFVFCFSTPSFGTSILYTNTSLSMSYVKNKFKSKSIFSINKNTLIANKLINKKRFPIFGTGSIISFVLAFLPILFISDYPSWLNPFYFMAFFLAVSIALSIIGLIVGEFWLWSVLGLILNAYVLYVLNDIRIHGMH